MFKGVNEPFMNNISIKPWIDEYVHYNTLYNSYNVTDIPF